MEFLKKNILICIITIITIISGIYFMIEQKTSQNNIVIENTNLEENDDEIIETKKDNKIEDDTIEENKKLKVFSNLYLPISVTKITNYELEENSKNITREDLTQKGTQKLKEGLEKEIGKDKNILRNISRRTRK